MTDRRISFEMLNAYVDGEMDTATAADVAREIAIDAALAHEVAALSRLRSTVAESIETPPLSVPHAAIDHRPRNGDRRQRRPHGVHSRIAFGLDLRS